LFAVIGNREVNTSLSRRLLVGANLSRESDPVPCTDLYLRSSVNASKETEEGTKRKHPYPSIHLPVIHCSCSRRRICSALTPAAARVGRWAASAARVRHPAGRILGFLLLLVASALSLFAELCAVFQVLLLCRS
jgi:hypothetical protein